MANQGADTRIFCTGWFFGKFIIFQVS